jgi:hypothetical protein
MDHVCKELILMKEMNTRITSVIFVAILQVSIYICFKKKIKMFFRTIYQLLGY